MGAMLQILIQSLIKSADAQPRKTSGPVARDLTGKTFGLLTVLRGGGAVGSARMWLCRCACGKEKPVRGNNLTSGYTRSCGCSKASHKAGRF